MLNAAIFTIYCRVTYELHLAKNISFPSLLQESDLSDSEMFKYDEGLSAIMKQLKHKKTVKKDGKEKRREIASFRQRAFDLLEVIVKGERCGDFVLVSVPFSDNTPLMLSRW